MRIEIDGLGTVEVEDSFKSMTPEAQNAFVGQIASHAQAGVRSSDEIAPAQTAEEAMASPEGQKLAGELRDKADRLLLEGSGAKSPIYATLSNAANTAMFNAPRNIKAFIMSQKSGRPFDEEYRYLSDIDEAAARQCPIAAGLGTAAGIVGQVAALPIAPAASIAGRLAQGAALGAGASGAAELLDSKDVGEAAKAAAAGAALGGAAPAVVEGVAGLVGKAGRYARGIFRPDAEAHRRVSIALQRDAASGGGQLDDAAMREAQNAGQPVVLADMGGETTRALARSAANTSPEARQAIAGVADRRFEDQAPRVSEFIMGLGSGRDSVAAREALKAKAAAANRPAYSRAFAQDEAGSWHEGLAQLAQAPVVADAIKGASRTGANKAAAEGFKPVKNPFTTLDSGEVTLTDQNVRPTLQFWDAVKRNLDDRIGSLQRSGEKSAARDAIELRNRLVGYLDRDFPAYKEARAGAASFFGAEDALEAGEKFATATGKNSEYSRVIESMNPHEKELFADGFVSRLSKKIDETGDRRSVVNSVFNSPSSRRRVEMAIGPKKAREFEAFMRVEGTMDELRKALGNSTTARQLVEIGLAGGIGGGIGFAAGGGDYTHAAMGAIANLGRKRIDARVAKRVGEILVSDNPVMMRELANMASRKRPVMDFIKDIETRIGEFAGPIGGKQVPIEGSVTTLEPQKRAVPTSRTFAAQ